MTWADNPDDEGSRVRGTRDHAANLDAFTVASADRQWFHRPGKPPPRASGNLRRSLSSSSTATARPQPMPPIDESKSQPPPAGESTRRARTSGTARSTSCGFLAEPHLACFRGRGGETNKVQDWGRAARRAPRRFPSSRPEDQPKSIELGAGVGVCETSGVPARRLVSTHSAIEASARLIELRSAR
jgi:hypothetical protein